VAKVTLLAPKFVLPAPGAEPRVNVGVAIVDGLVATIDFVDVLSTQWPDATVVPLPDCLLMPGLVNAHQHGRGVSQIQLGYPDQFLELWIHNRRGRGVLDPYPITKLAAVKMVANGVTTAIHANYSYGSGDYEAEVRASLRAYEEVGLRVTMCIGAMDRGTVAYPPHEACFLHGLPTRLADWLALPRPPAYAGDGQGTVDLMHRLLADYAGHPTIRFCYGPAGPQWVTDELMRFLAEDAERNDLGLHMHMLESPAQAAAVRELYPDGVLESYERMGILSDRTVLAHGVWVNDADIEVMARKGCIVVRNSGCNLRLRNGIAPMADYMRHGVRVAVGTDNNSLADDEDLLKELRLTGALASTPDWNANPPPTAADLLSMAITYGAAAAQIDGKIGVIEPGAKADLIAISTARVGDPYLDADMPVIHALLARSEGADVRLTMVNGKIVYRDGMHAFVDRIGVGKAAADAAKAARLPRDMNNVQRAKDLGPFLIEHYRAISRRNQRN
jgi:5-methylthioadenosine/S-adenosylhomocysteine deaminase